MLISKALKVNDVNHLEIGGVDVVELVNKYGTPLYVMDEELIRENCRIYKDAMNNYYSGNGLVLYANKAFCSLATCKIMEEEGLGIDVVSGGELYTAIKAGFPMNKVYFHGNNKTYDELEFAIENDIRIIVVDNKEELETINNIAIKTNKNINISFRIKPGIEAHTHEYIQTGQIDSKFGFTLNNGEAFDIVDYALKMSNITVVGIHCHIGSQIFDITPFELAAKILLQFILEIKNNLGLVIEELNLGGGYGIKYITSHDPIECNRYMESVSKIVKSFCSDNNIKLPFIVMEPGRSIVGPSGITLYKVGSIKDIENIRKYILVDGGMADNPRYALYQAEYTAVIANRVNGTNTEKVTIGGRCCESGDILLKDVLMPIIQVGDIIAVLSTGAYNYSMSSNYNRIPRPPVILVKNGNDRIIIKRETYDDLIRNDIMI